MAAQRAGLVFLWRMLWRQFIVEEPWALEWIRMPSDACGQANSIWIRYVLMGKFLNPERKSCGFKNIRICIDGAWVYSLGFKCQHMLYFLKLQSNLFTTARERGKWPLRGGRGVIWHPFFSKNASFSILYNSKCINKRNLTEIEINRVRMKLVTFKIKLYGVLYTLFVSR